MNNVKKKNTALIVILSIFGTLAVITILFCGGCFSCAMCMGNISTEENITKNTNNSIINSNNNIENNTTNQALQENQETTTEKETTEFEYKDLCKLVYNDDVFKGKLQVGEHIKFYGYTSQKLKYTIYDSAYYLVEKITKKYNLDWNTLGCCVMHEESKDKAIPSYFGNSVYIMFPENGKYDLYSFDTGKEVIVYGQVIQNKNGIYIIAEYIELNE